MTAPSWLTPHMRDHLLLLRERRNRPHFESAPYSCVGPEHRHHVRSDNPRRTGRCEICRSFVVSTRKGWRRATPAQAIMWGLM